MSVRTVDQRRGGMAARQYGKLNKSSGLFTATRSKVCAVPVGSQRGLLDLRKNGQSFALVATHVTLLWHQKKTTRVSRSPAGEMKRDAMHTHYKRGILETAPNCRCGTEGQITSILTNSSRNFILKQVPLQ